jgi:hypothetical protein
MLPAASCVYWTTFEAASASPDTNAPATTHDIANHWRSTGSSLAKSVSRRLESHEAKLGLADMSHTCRNRQADHAV